MVHTLELSQRLNYSDERRLDKKLAAFFNGDVIFNSKEKMFIYGNHSNCPFKIGIERFFMENKGAFNRLSIIMNPAKVFYGNQVNVSDMNTAHMALCDLESLFAQIGISEYYPYLKLSRIDYAIDIFLETQEMVETYVALLQRGDIPHNFTPRMEYNTTSHRFDTYKDSLYYENKYVTINFYNKYEQLKEKAAEFIDPELARGILRLEVQWKRPRIHYIVKHYGLQDLPHEFLNEQLAVTTVQDYLSKIAMLGDYYSLSKAKTLVLNSAFRDRHKDEMISFLTDVNNKRSLSEVKEKGMYPPNIYERIIKQLNQLNINPVTIPGRWGYDYLPNLMNLIHQ